MLRFLLAVALSSACSIQAQVTLKGYVLTIDGPLKNALVLIDRHHGVITDSIGNFTVEKLVPGTYTISISHLGYRTLEKTIQLKNKEIFYFELQKSITLAQEVIIEGTRATIEQPISQSNISKAEIEKENNGQDLPFILRKTPSLVVTSDAGSGVGYTGMRIRGSDATRINVTINSVALNDAESHGVFWVDIPDFASSVESIQVQRGVGTSSSGSGAFGGSINLLTKNIETETSASISNSYGSFNTWKNTIDVSSGLLNERWIFNGRLSKISSDGFVDRAASDLKSFFAQVAYLQKNTILKAIAFGGKEITYQSWWGVPEAKLSGITESLETHISNNNYTEAEIDNLRNSDNRTYNYYTYENQIDDYAQNHIQLQWIQKINPKLNLNSVLHYTKGRGYFEEFKYKEDLSNYGLADVNIGDTTITNSDIIRRRWLDNDYYGINTNLQFQINKIEIKSGVTLNRYDGSHFGKIDWSEWSLNVIPGNQYYLSNAVKTEQSFFVKMNFSATNKLGLYIDLQQRFINYKSAGTDNDLRNLDFSENYAFFNPKGGFNYRFNKSTTSYFSIAVAHREPIRSDFTDAIDNQYPKPEEMTDYEFGIKKIAKKYMAALNVFYMNYKNQLVLTGNINDVGAPIRTNINRSFRKGIEIEGTHTINARLNLFANASFSNNKIENFRETLVDYTNGFEYVYSELKNTDISFSPELICNAGVDIKVSRNARMSWHSKYVGDQFLDNSSNENSMLTAYLRNDIHFSYELRNKYVSRTLIKFQVNNVLNELYSSSGYTYSYIYGDLITENFYYPQAGRHFFLNLDISF